MKTLMKKQMSSGFVIVAVAVMMITSQIPEAFADDVICENTTLFGTITDNILVPSNGGFNICVLDNVDLQGNITVEENAAVFVINGSDLEGDIKLLGQFSAINFEGTAINTVKGNVQGTHEDSYIYLDSVTIDGNVQGKGEVYVSSNSDRFSGDVRVLGNYIIEGNETTEFVLDGLFVGGNVLINKQLTITITHTEVTGNIHIKDNTSSVINIEENTIGGHLEFEANSFGSVLISENDISKNLNIKDNSGTITIENNDVGQSAFCENNDVPILGDPNTNFVKKNAKKQCKNLFEKPTQNFP